jgi:tRNA (cytosine40_48-C5)-methyltransferase
MKTNVFLNRYKSWGNDISPDKVIVKPALRVNTLKISENELVKRLKANGVKLEKISWLKNAYFYTSKFALSSTPEYLQGYYYLQDAASQIPAMVLDPKPGEIVLDMAAAPGGKTTQLSELMKNSGVIIALDVRNDRLSSLKNNIERMGCKNIIVYNKDANYANDLNIKFDKVLLDAPCSGNFCIDKDWFAKRRTEDFNEKAFIQRKLLKSGVSVLKNGGIIVYSTCSLEKEENEKVIEWAISNLGVELIEMTLDIGDSGLEDTVSMTRRLWPNKTMTQGFFVAKMIKVVE